MAKVSLLPEAPPEILTCLFRNCGSFSVLKSLIFTCKRFNDVWKSNSSTIIWDVGRADMYAFNDALMAVRATEIVKQAVQGGQLPPHPFPVKELSGQPGRYPSVRELKLILGFQHFVRYVEFVQLDHRKLTSWADSSDTSGDRRRRFYSAMYRVLLAGAVLHGIYNEPLVRGETHGPPDFLKRFKTVLRSQLRPYPAATFTKSEIEYLLGFPVYNFESHQAQEPYFHDLAELFVDESRIRLRDEGPIAVSPKPPSHLNPKFYDLDPLQNIIFHEAGQLAYAYEIIRMFYESAISGVKYPGSGKPFRNVSIVLFGNFLLEEFSIPQGFTASGTRDATATSINPSFPSCQNIVAVMSYLYRSSGQVNRYDVNCLAAGPPLPFLQHIFRRYLNLRFADNAFAGSTRTEHNIYEYHLFYPNYEPPAEPWLPHGLFEYADVPSQNPHYA